jgi:hypothetical protein
VVFTCRMRIKTLHGVSSDNCRGRNSSVGGLSIEGGQSQNDETLMKTAVSMKDMKGLMELMSLS